MRSPDKIWIEPAWAETFARPDGDPAKVAYIPEAIAQAAVAAALEAAAKQVGDHGDWMQSHNLIGNGYDFAWQAKAIRALITPAQHDALAAYVAAEVAKARAEDAEMLAESRAYALALQEELRVRTAKLERECRLTQAQVDRMLVNSTQTHADLAGCKIALEQAWASNRERAAKITALTEAMTEIHAMIVGECPSLLNEDSGGNGELSCQINDLLTGEMTMKTAVGKAADALLEHIVYYDLVERRGAEIADAVIAELVEIGVKSAQIGAEP